MGNLASALCPSAKKGKASGLRKLIRETQSSDEDDDMAASTADTDPSRPWHADFKKYIDTSEAKPPAGMSVVQWWGVSILSLRVVLRLLTSALI
jgi:hypothetical protein